MRDNGHRVVDQFRVQGLQPVDARVTAEPSHLFAGESLGFLCDVREGVVHIPDAVQQVDDLLIAERTYGGGTQMRAQPFDFFDEPIVIHLLGAQIDAMVQIRAVQVESDLHGRNHVPVARQTGRIRFAGKLDDLQRTDGAAWIAWVHARGGLGVFGPQLVEQSTGTLGFLAFLKTCAHVGIGAGEGDVIDGRSGVQAGAADENRPDAT